MTLISILRRAGLAQGHQRWGDFSLSLGIGLKVDEVLLGSPPGQGMAFMAAMPPDIRRVNAGVRNGLVGERRLRAQEGRRMWQAAVETLPVPWPGRRTCRGRRGPSLGGGALEMFVVEESR